jgi:hypothetical protein
MKESANVKINGQEREISLSLIGLEEIITTAVGLVSDPQNYRVIYKRPDGSEGFLLPSEKMYPVEGMEFTVGKK